MKEYKIKNIYDQLKTIKLEISKKNKFNYASWSDVWDAVLSVDPNATYEVHEAPSGFPAFINSMGGLVKVSVTIKEVTKTQWLPIMNNYNQSIPKDTIKTTDVNKSIQRCLVKCVALFGLGLYIYRGEDLPEDQSENNLEAVEIEKLS